MARRMVQEEDKIKMNELYATIGTYAGVARVVGFAPSTVKRYISEECLSQEVVEIERFNTNTILVDNVDYPSDWKDFLRLSAEEKEKTNTLRKEVLV